MHTTTLAFVRKKLWRVATEGESGMQKSMFDTKLREPSFQVVWLVTFFLLQDSKGAYLQPSLHNVIASRGC